VALEKLISIKNVGRLTTLAPRGDVRFRELTLLYGPNGQGKTTIAGILRSLRTGDAAYVMERASLGGAAPEIEILLSSGNVKFAAGAWSATEPEIEIFDSTFVSDNVYTGEHVDPGNRKNLYEVVVGAAAVALARQIDGLDSRSRTASRELASLERQLREVIQAPFEIDAFLALSPEEGVDDRIRDVTTKLSAVRKSREVLSRRELEPLTVPDAPRTVLPTLQKTIAAITSDAEEAVRQHIQKHLDRRGEQWLRQGVEYLRGDDPRCPFCMQDTSAIDLVGLFRDYFSSTYRDNLVSIERAVNEVEQRLGEPALNRVQKEILDNESRIQSWSDLADLTYARPSIERLEGAWRHLRTLLEQALKQKLSNPSEEQVNDPQVEAALRDFESAVSLLGEANEAIRRANAEIAQLKQQAAATGAEDLEKELRRLRNIQIRQESSVAETCTKLLRAKSEREELDEEKRQKRSALESMAVSVLAQYETSINALLQKFGATFRLAAIRPIFAGGRASSTYRIAINELSLELGDANTPRGTPCFRTALSAGDKSTLALAFFLARLQHDPNLSAKIIVLDDPLSSLDSFRIACTQNEIHALARRARQVIVLSHDEYFLKRLYDYWDKSKLKCVHIIRESARFSLSEWNVEHACLPQAYRDYFNMRRFLDEGAPVNGDLLSLAGGIRPYLEGHLRDRYPDQFAPTEWLGDFIVKIRDAAPASPLYALLARITELEALNEYAKGFHHSSPPTPQELELRSYVERAIKFVQA